MNYYFVLRICHFCCRREEYTCTKDGHIIRLPDETCEDWEQEGAE